MTMILPLIVNRGVCRYELVRRLKVVRGVCVDRDMPSGDEGPFSGLTVSLRLNSIRLVSK